MKSLLLSLAAICACFLMLLQTAQAQLYTDNGDGTCTLIGPYLSIPTNINGLTVTSIGDNAFNHAFLGSFLTNVVIPGTVTNIGVGAFQNNPNLTNITIGDGVTTIGASAFTYISGVKSLTFGTGLTTIGADAFDFGPSSIYFKGDAPTSVDTNVLPYWHGTFYYLLGTTGWSNPFYGVTTMLMGDFSLHITEFPVSKVVNNHDPASFGVTASGISLGYQWLLNGTNIQGATSTTLMISNVVQTNLGTYTVLVTDQSGAVTNASATLSMYPFISNPFTGAVTYWGKDATIGVQAGGTGPFSFQWFDNGIAITNETNQSLTLTSIQFTNAGLYSVVVSSSLGSVTNVPGEVVVEPAGVSLGFSPTLTINGVAGYKYIIQSSTNLTDTNAWVTLTNLTLTQPVQLWVDTNVDATSPFNSKYYYRVLPGQ